MTLPWRIRGCFPEEAPERWQRRVWKAGVPGGRESVCQGIGMLGELCGQMLFLYLLMSLLCRCQSPQPWPACSSGNSLCFLCLDPFPSSWLAPLTIIGRWIKLHLFRDARPDYPSEEDSSCYSYHPSCCVLQLTCHNADCLIVFLLRGVQTVISTRAFHIYWYVHSALPNACP